ncbi:hypothetical protein, partial [Acinetobacter guillouiae]|uniref:hypothetical protein n=1 Tax=Acinetobacter guillouiae TaxID=106649 RepID=UPI0026E333CC
MPYTDKKFKAHKTRKLIRVEIIKVTIRFLQILQPTNKVINVKPTNAIIDISKAIFQYSIFISHK